MAVAQQHQPHEPQINGRRYFQPPISSTTTVDNMNMTSKRQRPSVRLVEIGEQPAASLTKQWKAINRVSKSRPLTNLVGLDEGKGEKEGEERERGDFNLDNLAIGSWKIKGSKPKRELKRPKMNWVSKKIDDEGGNGSGDNNDNNNDNVVEDGFSKDFEMEGSESLLKEQNPVHDSSNNVKDLEFRAPHIIRVGFGDEGVDLDGPSDNGGNSARRYGEEVDGIRVWLDELGLSRYWPVFEFHEVDEEVLPWITFEDLKDMGINAVGSRRKIYCAIQKLHKGFS